MLAITNMTIKKFNRNVYLYADFLIGLNNALENLPKFVAYS